MSLFTYSLMKWEIFLESFTLFAKVPLLVGNSLVELEAKLLLHGTAFSSVQEWLIGKLFLFRLGLNGKHCL